MTRLAGLALVVLGATVSAGGVASAQSDAAPRTDGWVVLPVEDYRALRSKAYPVEKDPEPPPVEATLTRVDYDLRVSGESAAGEARLTIDVLKDGWVSVAIPGGLLVREARLDGKPVSLVDTPAPHVLLSKTGRSVLSLDVAVPISAAAGSESLTLPASAAAVTRVGLVVPRAKVELAVGNGFLAERAEAPGESRFVAHGRAGAALSFSWRQKREDHRTSQALRLRGTVSELVGLGEDGAQVSATVGIEVVQGVAPSVTLALGDGVVINQVTGALVADWEFKPGVLTVTFLEPVEGAARFVVAGEAKTPREGAVPVPLFRLPAAERETGGVGVEVLGAGEIKDQSPRGLDAADASDLGEPIAGRDAPSLVAFRFRPQDGKAARTLSVTVSRYTPQAVLVANVEEARYQVLLTEEGKGLVRARYAVRNNQRSFLALTLPEGAVLWSASVSGRAVRPGRTEAGGLLLPLEKGRAGEDAPAFPVEIVYLGRGPAWDKQGRTRLALPTLDLQVSRTGLVLHHPSRFRMTPEPGAFRVDAYAEPQSAALRRDGPPPPPPPAAPVAKQEAAAGKMKVAEEQDKDQGELKSLLDRFQKEGRSNRVAGVLPVQVPFPAFGPMDFFVAELTAEGTAPGLDITYRRTGGGR
jgi:hypothetical protein